MTIKELSNYYYIDKQIKQLQNKLEELEEKLLGSSQITDMPRSGRVSKPTEDIAIKIAELKKVIVEKRNRLIEENIFIEKYIDTVSDAEIQTIIRMRFIELKNWYAIGKELGFDYTWCCRKLHRYMANNKKQEKQD